MEANRLWTIGAILAMIGIVAGGWFLGVQPQLDSAAAANDQRAGIARLNSVNEAALRKLQADDAKKGELQERLAALAASVPSQPDLPEFYAAADAVATANNVVLANVATGASMPYPDPGQQSGTKSASAQPSGSTSTPTPSPSGVSTAAPTATPAPTPSPGAPTVTSPLITSTSFVAIPVTFSLTGNSADILNAVHGLQTAPRLFLINGLTTAVPPPGSTLQGVQATVSGYIYVVLAASAHAVGAG